MGKNKANKRREAGVCSSMDRAEAIAEFAGGRGSMKLLTTPSHMRNGPIRHSQRYRMSAMTPKHPSCDAVTLAVVSHRCVFPVISQRTN